MNRFAAGCAASVLLLFKAASALAQPSPGAVAIEPPAAEPSTWEFSASAFGYVVPEERDYGSATVTADRGIWHLEARYNYEGLDTGSFWAGANFAFGKAVAFEVTPMVGGVVGHTEGVAPGYHLTVRWKRLELYSEGDEPSRRQLLLQLERADLRAVRVAPGGAGLPADPGLPDPARRPAGDPRPRLRKELDTWALRLQLRLDRSDLRFFSGFGLLSS
jgi:hypothetical protein